MTKSKRSSGRTSAPCRRRRNFSTRCGSGVIGAIAIQTANVSNHMDLSYAPTFSPVWDPVLLAARKAASVF